MNVLIQVDHLEIAKRFIPGRYNLHCKVETAEGTLTKSSIPEFNEEGHLTDTSSNELKFEYEFQDRHSETTISLILNDLHNTPNKTEVGKAFVPMKFQCNTSTLKKITYLTSRLNNLAIAQHIGTVIIEVTNKFSVETTHSNNVHWIDLQSTPEHLFLLKAETQQNSANIASPQEEDNAYPEIPLVLLEQESVMNAPAFPCQNSIVTCIFHSFATFEPDADYQHVFCFDAQVVNEQASEFPFAHWNILSNSRKTLYPTSILASSSHLSSKLNQNVIGLHLFKDNIKTPIFSAYENLQDLIPFHYYHRGWLGDYDKATSPFDPLMQATNHIITSVHYIPPASDFSLHSGLELALMRLNVSTEEAHRQVMLAAQLLSSNNDARNTSEGPFEPPFLRRSNQTNAENCKLALIQPQHGSDTSKNKAYFFFSNNGNNDNLLDSTDDAPILVFHTCSIDPTSNKPWWENHDHSWASIEINQSVYSILADEQSKYGVRWIVNWNNQDKRGDCSAELILRWKSKEIPFLNNMKYEDYKKLRLLNTLQEHVNYNNEELQLTIEEPNEEQEEFSFYVSPETKSTPVKLQQVPNHYEMQYFEAIDKLGDNIRQLREENARLQQDNGFLQGQLVQLATLQSNFHTNSETRKELEAFSKIDLIHKVLSLQLAVESETKQKEKYQEKVLRLQNELLSRNDLEKEFVTLQEAHKEQQELVQVLQRKVEKYHQCYKTNLQQEEIIDKLETLLADLQSQVKNDKENTSLTEQQDRLEDQTEAFDWDIPEHILEQRIGRLEAITTHTHANQASLAVMLEQNKSRELQLQEMLARNETEMSKIQHENRKLKASIIALAKNVIPPSRQPPSHSSAQNPNNHQPILNEPQTSQTGTVDQSNRQRRILTTF